MSARTDILSAIRRSHGRRPEDPPPSLRAAPPRAGEPARLIPQTGQLKGKAMIERFIERAREAAATVTMVTGTPDIQAAITQFLSAHNLPARIRAAPDPILRALSCLTIDVEYGGADPADHTGVSVGFAGIAETGTLMLASGPESPSLLNFLPENHIVILPEHRIVGALEDGWALLRLAQTGDSLPRTVNLITGPSRSADIELTLQFGAHGPRRLHIIIAPTETSP